MCLRFEYPIWRGREVLALNNIPWTYSKEQINLRIYDDHKDGNNNNTKIKLYPIIYYKLFMRKSEEIISTKNLHISLLHGNKFLTPQNYKN